MRPNPLEQRDALASDPRNLRFVASIARTIHSRLPPSFDLDDLIAIGNVALLDAARRYSPESHAGTPFSAFARQAIRGAMIDTFRRNKYVEATRLSIDAVVEDDLDDSRPDYKGTAVSRALLRVATTSGLDNSIDSERLKQRVRTAITWLPAQQRELLAIRYADDEPEALEIGRRMHISRTRVAVVHARAIANLRRLLTPGTARKRATPRTE